MKMISANVDSDECIADRFKRDYNEQYDILVRMHLSFVLDINTEENDAILEKTKIKKWNIVSFGKKLRLRGVMEGMPLTQEGICQVYQLIEYLKSGDNLKTEGIFRRTGSLERQQDLKNLLNKGQTLHLENSAFSIHDCASVLKGFLAELPEPLLTDAHFPVYCQVADSCGIIKQSTQEVKLLEALQLLFLLLPNENKVLLKDILGLLHLTASYEEFNKMSPDNLAKLFTPHLLCPRKLSPEVLLKDSQILFKIISFMIKKFSELFKIPNKLVLDFRARYEKKKILSPSKRLNESISDAANTVFTFVDHERTAKENESNPTEKALAQLYAHIQTLPDSSKKRKLVKQFNKENVHSTPLQIRNGVTKNKTIGDSIKKHLFHKGLVRKKGLVLCSSSNEDILGTPSSSPIISKKLFCHHNHNSSSEATRDETPAKRAKKACTSYDNIITDKSHASIDYKRSKWDFDSSITDNNRACNVYLTSTPACLPLRACSDINFTPEDQGRKSMSPITRSTQRMTRAMQETMMTPRSRKPVLVVSGTNINALPRIEHSNFIMDSVVEEIPNTSSEDEILTKKTVFPKSKSETDLIETKTVPVQKLNKSESPSASLSDTFKDYLSNRDMITLSSPIDSSFSSRTDDFTSTEFETLSSSRISDSLLYCLNGNKPDDVSTTNLDKNTDQEKILVLKPKQFDEDGKPIIFETSF